VDRQPLAQALLETRAKLAREHARLAAHRNRLEAKPTAKPTGEKPMESPPTLRGALAALVARVRQDGRQARATEDDHQPSNETEGAAAPSERRGVGVIDRASAWDADALACHEKPGRPVHASVIGRWPLRVE